MIKRDRLCYQNMPGHQGRYDELMREVRRITSQDTENIFAFVVRFHGTPHTNFDLTVYLKEEGVDEQKPTAILHRGDSAVMRNIVNRWKRKNRK